MAESAQQGGKLNVFISYSRDDLAFAEQLYAALEAFGFGVSMDQRGISAGEDWQKRLGSLIRDADTVAFVLSPSSARSQMCAWEVGEAIQLGKRIIPVLCRSLEDAKAPEKLASLNYIFFYAEPKSDGSGFGAGLALLVKALNTDLDWLREHTRYLQRATEWDAGDRPANRLLSGPDIATAKAWAARRPKNAPEPTALQLDFIKASEAENIRQQSAEAQRLQQVAEALAEREKAQEQEAEARKSEAEAQKREVEAQKREAEQAKRVATRTMMGLAVAIVLLLAAVVSAFVAYQQRERARKATLETQQELDRANRALAQSINNDLGFEPRTPFTARERNALWRLAVADDSVKHGYISILTQSPEETVRASPGFPQISRALGILRPTPTEAESMTGSMVRAFQINPGVSFLPAELKALAPRISNARADLAFDSLLRQIDQSPNVNAFAVGMLAEGLQALAPKLTEAQASPALERVLEQIGRATDPDVLVRLAEALQALPAKLTEAQADQALEPVLEQMGRVTAPYELFKLAEVLQPLPARLTDAQAGQALDPVLKLLGQTTEPAAIQSLARALTALAPKLTEAQAAQALDPVLKQLDQTTDPLAIQWLVDALGALPAELTDAQASQGLDSLFRPIGRSHGSAQFELASGLQALARKLTEAQAGQALDPLLRQIDQSVNFDALLALAEGLQALAPKLTEAQAAQAIDPVLKQIGRPTNTTVLWGLVQALRALPAKLTEEQTSQALEPMLKQIAQATLPGVISDMAEGLQALAPKLTEAQAAQALDPLLGQIGRATRPEPLHALAQALQAMPTRLTETQATGALDAVLKMIDRTNNSKSLKELAQALEALTPKLSDAQAVRASKAAASSLAWAADDEEAAHWAGALAILSRSPGNRDGILVNAIAYPAAGGSATEVLLDAIRAGQPDAPAKEAGTQAALEWLAKKNPDVLRPPVCPQPLQPGLKCPP